MEILRNLDTAGDRRDNDLDFSLTNFHPPWPMPEPINSRPWDGSFYPFNFRMKYLTKQQTTILRSTGWDSFGRTIIVDFSGYDPYFYVRVVNGASSIAEICQLFETALRSDASLFNSWHAEDNAGPAGRASLHSTLIRTPAIILKSECVRGRELNEPFAIPGGPIYLYYKICVRHTQAVLACKNALKKGLIKPADPRAKLLLSEASIDYALRVTADNSFRPCEWYEANTTLIEAAARQIYTRHLMQNKSQRDPQFRDHNFARSLPNPNSIYALQIEAVHFDQFVRSPIQKIPDLRAMAFDIETLAPGGQFPDALRHRVGLICVYLSKGDAVRNYSFFNIQHSEISRNDNKFLKSMPSEADVVYCFDREEDMLNCFHTFVLSTSPQVISAHNGNGFDWPYMIDRAKALGLKNFANMGFAMEPFGPVGSVWHEAATTRVTGRDRGMEVSAAWMGGRVIIDTMKIARDGPDKQQKSSLKVQSQIHIDPDRGKYEFELAKICNFQRTSYGRANILIYCLRDAEVVMLLNLKKDTLAFMISTSSGTGLVLQDCLNRGSSAQGEAMMLFTARSQFMRVSSSTSEVMPALDIWAELKNASRRIPVLTDSCTERTRRSLFRRKNYPREREIGQFAGGLNVLTTTACMEGAVLVVDFRSLYPSVSQELNACASTLISLQDAVELGLEEGVDFTIAPGWDTNIDERDAQGNAVHITPEDRARPCFLTPSIWRGVLPTVYDATLELRRELKSELREIQNAMSATPNPTDEQKRLARTLDTKQAAVKLRGNSLYGVIGLFLSKWHNRIVSESITRCGRAAVREAWSIIEEPRFAPAKPFYGHTDSIFIHLKDVSLEDARKLGFELEEAINQHFRDRARNNSPPLVIEFEKIYHPLFFITGKSNYIGRLYDMTMHPRDAPMSEAPFRLDVKGLQIKKSNCPTFVSELGMRMADVIFCTKDRSPIHCLDLAIVLVKECAARIANGDLTITELLQKKTLKKPLKEYTQNSAHVVAARMMESRLHRAATGLELSAWSDNKRRRDASSANPDLDEEAEHRGGGTSLGQDRARAASAKTYIPVGTCIYWIQKPVALSNRKCDGVMLIEDVVKSGNRPDWPGYLATLEQSLTKTFGKMFDVMYDKVNYIGEVIKPYYAPAKREVCSSNRGPMDRLPKFAIHGNRCRACETKEAHANYSSRTRTEIEGLRSRQNQEKLDNCVLCVGEDSNAADSCATYTCKSWGTRFKLSQDIEDLQDCLRQTCERHD